jgi:hypothetical protein
MTVKGMTVKAVIRDNKLDTQRKCTTFRRKHPELGLPLARKIVEAFGRFQKHPWDWDWDTEQGQFVNCLRFRTAQEAKENA